MAADLGAGDSDEMSEISGINITPFVDVVLVLLVIFMVTAPALMKDVIGLQLPKAQSGDGKVMQTLSIAVTKQGQLLVNGAVTNEESLVNEAKSGLLKNRDLQVIISADKEAKHGDVVHAVDLVKTAGVAKFAFQIEHQN